MIKDIKAGMQLIKYGLNFQTSVALTLFVLGIIVLNMFLLPTPLFATLFVPLSMIGIVQQIHTTTVSTMVQTSSYKKKLRTTISTYFAGIAMLIGNTLSVVMHWIAYLRVKDNTSYIYLGGLRYDPKTYANTIVICAFLMVIVLVFMILGNIFFWPCTLISFGIWIGYWWFDVDMDFVLFDVSIELAVLLSYIVVLLGIGVLYVLNHLLYKCEYAELTFRGLIKRASK